MWPSPSAFFPFGFFVFIAASAVTVSTAKSNCNPKACQRNGDNEKPVCGSDGLTYPNRCYFEKTRCHNKNVTLVQRSPCQIQRPCSEWESFLSANPNYTFHPKCRTDGSYESSQCNQIAGFCWCVTPEGLPVPYTAVKWRRNGKQRCGIKKKTTRRRSPSRKNRSRSCNEVDNSIFNKNMIDIFHTEYFRANGVGPSHSISNHTDNLVLFWKFQELDLNKDEILDKNEYKDIKKVVKKAVKPKRCAKSFPRNCDLNNDQMISRQEWAECITRDSMPDGHQNLTSYDDPDDYEDNFGSNISRSPENVLNAVIVPTYEDNDSSDPLPDDPTDCLTDRKTVLDEPAPSYIPECTPDGRYQKIQCYKSAGYCWCVHEDTGKNIPGTSVKNGVPKCDQLTPVNRPMKGCPDDKKFVFMKDLIQFLHTRMAKVTNGTSTFNGLAWISTKEEQAATWSFVFFDTNQNKVLEKNEWKAFKDLVSPVKGLKKCGKKLPRYCDINKDRKISMTEWLDCLNVQQGVPTPVSSRAANKSTLSMLMED